MSGRVLIVDENDVVVGAKDRESLKFPETFRVSGLWITNSQGEILLAKRASVKKVNPGKWGPAVTGTIEEGETYEMNIIKEAKEEIGLTGHAFVKAMKVKMVREMNYFCQWYTLVLDRPAGSFVLKEDEVVRLKWFSESELLEESRLHPESFTAGVMHWVNKSPHLPGVPREKARG